MKTYARNANDLALLFRINQHDRLAGTLGILPNHLITFIRSHDSENVKKIINDLTTFWSTYNIWAKHQTLNRTYWKIIPLCCKADIKEKKTDPLKKKRKRRTKKLVSEDCKNPFHYLLLKKNMQAVHGTCNCNIQTHRTTTHNVDIKTILGSYHMPSSPDTETTNIELTDTSGLDHKHTPAIRESQLTVAHSHVKTSGDISREQQDRTKRFKQKLLSDFLM